MHLSAGRKEGVVGYGKEAGNPASPRVWVGSSESSSPPRCFAKTRAPRPAARLWAAQLDKGAHPVQPLHHQQNDPTHDRRFRQARPRPVDETSWGIQRQGQEG